MPKSKKKKQSEEIALKQQKAAFETFLDNVQFQKDMRDLVEPLGQALIQFGIDPVSFLQSSQGQAILAPTQEAIASNFGAQRQNLVDALGQTGFSFGGGIGTAPFANLLSEEAGAQSGNVQNLVAQSLGLGLQGANILQGQQGIFNPVPVGSLANQSAQGISSGQELATALAGAGIGAAGTVIGGLNQPSSGGGQVGGIGGTFPSFGAGPGFQP